MSPGKTIPLANRELWRYTPQSFLDPNAALHVPLIPEPKVVDESLSINDGAILYPGMKIDSWLWKARFCICLP